MTRAITLLACLALAAIAWGLWHTLLEHAAAVMRWVDTVPLWALVVVGAVVFAGMLALAGRGKMVER